MMGGPRISETWPRYWPMSTAEKELENDVSMKERLKSDPNVIHMMLTTEKSSKPKVHKIMDISLFSTKNKLLHVITLVLRFIKNLKMARSNVQLSRTTK